jgi:tetratricopeptide (TPR) repeat protein
MQQYRVNYPLLIGLAVGMLISSGAVYALWKFQIERRSDTLITEAEKAVAENDLKAAVQLYYQYIRINSDDTPQRIKFAETWANLAEQFDSSMEDRSRAIRVLEETLREFPNEKGLRMRLAKTYGKFGMYKDGLAHLNFLLDDREAQLLKAVYLVRSNNLDEAKAHSFKLIGYDPKEKKFDPSKPGTAPHDPETYLNLALILRTKEDQHELADQVMEQAVAANPDSARAYLARGQYNYRVGEIENGLRDFGEAYKRGPEDANVLAVVARQAANDNEYDRALEYVKKGKELHPKTPAFYQIAASIAAAQEKPTDAIAEIDAGLKVVGPPASYELLIFKAELQLQAKDLKAVRQSIEDMKAASISPLFCEWYEAKVLMQEEKWYQANELLTKLRPYFAADPRYGPELLYLLGFSYHRLGQYELSMRTMDELLQLNPENDPAKFIRHEAAQKIGRIQELVSDDPVQKAVNAELLKPKAQQNWAEIQALIEKLGEEKGLDELTRKLYWGRILIARQEYAAARNLARELQATAPKDNRVDTLTLDTVRFDPAAGQGPAVALQLMDRLELEDNPNWRLYKADLLIAINDERTKPQLASLLSNIDSWTPPQKAQLWSEMADRYLSSNLRMIDEGRRCLMLVAEQQPDDLQARMKLYSIALEANDDAAVKAAQDAILAVVGSMSDSNWLYTEARRRLAMIHRNRAGAETLGEVREILERALADRPDWHELHALNAEVELLANNGRLALQHLDKAASLGRLSPAGVAEYIKLLAADGQLQRANEMLSSLSEPARQALLGDVYTELLFRTNKIDDAIKAARAQAEANPENPQLQFRYAELLARSTDQPSVTPEQKKATLGQAIQAIEQVVKLQPTNERAWYSLVVYNAMTEEREKAQKALRDMQLSLSGDSLQLWLARCHEALGRWFDAEPLYRAVYEADPDDIDRAQQLAEFYLGTGYRQEDRFDKATPLLNQILRAGAEGKIPANHRHLLWARRMGAKMLAGSGDYQQLLKAERMLASNSRDGSLSIADRLDMAQILAPRPEPESRLKAVQLLEEVDEVQPLGEVASLMLGNLYYQFGDWNNCQRRFLTALSRYPKSIELRTRFASLLLARNNPNAYSMADPIINKELRQLAPTSRDTFELVLRHQIRTGRQKEVHDALIRQIPQNVDPKSITDQQMTMLQLYASLLVELKDFERAEQIHQLLAKRDPKYMFTLAEFVGVYRDVPRSFEILDSQVNADSLGQVIRSGVNIIRVRRNEIGGTFDARIEGWLERALSSNIGSIPLTLSKAEFLEVQQKYPEAIAVYRQLLANPDVTGFGRAVMLNNLSYLMVLSEGGQASGGVDPLALVDEAIQIWGPTADILDTRAVVYIARKQFDQAIQDLDLSVVVNPTASKYFHKALAHLGNKQNKAAIDAWAEAEKLGLTRESINPLELPRYQEAAAQITKLRESGA